MAALTASPDPRMLTWACLPASISRPASPGQPDAVDCLRAELAAPGYVCRPVALGINTDAWQPVERQLGISATACSK
jgi:hypothetical protein